MPVVVSCILNKSICSFSRRPRRYFLHLSSYHQWRYPFVFFVGRLPLFSLMNSIKDSNPFPKDRCRDVNLNPSSISLFSTNCGSVPAFFAARTLKTSLWIPVPLLLGNSLCFAKYFSIRFNLSVHSSKRLSFNDAICSSNIRCAGFSLFCRYFTFWIVNQFARNFPIWLRGGS